MMELYGADIKIMWGDSDSHCEPVPLLVAAPIPPVPQSD